MFLWCFMFETFSIYSISFILIVLSFISSLKGIRFFLFSLNLALLSYEAITTNGNYLSQVFIIILSLFYVESALNLKTTESDEITKRIFLTTGFYSLIFEENLFVVGLTLIFVDILTNYTLELKKKGWLQNIFEVYTKHVALLFFITLYFFAGMGSEHLVINYMAIIFGSFVILSNIQLFKASSEFQAKFEIDFKKNGLFNGYFIGILTNFYVAKCMTVLLKEMPADLLVIFLWVITLLILSSLLLGVIQFLVYKANEFLVYRYIKILGLSIFAAYIAEIADHDSVFQLSLAIYLAFCLYAYLCRSTSFFSTELKFLSLIFLTAMPFNPLFSLFSLSDEASATQIIISFCIILSGCIMLYGTMRSLNQVIEAPRKFCAVAVLYGVTIIGISIL